jgi:hypothetical protein
MHLTALEGAEIILGKYSADSLLKPPFGGFRIETVIWIQEWFKKFVGASRNRKLYI